MSIIFSNYYLDIESDSLENIVIVSSPIHGILEMTGITGYYIADPDFNGLDTFEWKAYDGENYSNTAICDIMITPVNDPPLVDSLFYQMDEDSQIQITLTAQDPEDDSLSFSIVVAPNHGSLTPIANNSFIYII